MKYDSNQSNSDDYEIIGDSEDLKNLESGIDEESLPFVFDVVTKGLYSDKYSSIVRELSSNSEDALKEAENLLEMTIDEFRANYKKAYKDETDEEIQELKDYFI